MRQVFYVLSMAQALKWVEESKRYLDQLQYVREEGVRLIGGPKWGAWSRQYGEVFEDAERECARLIIDNLGPDNQLETMENNYTLQQVFLNQVRLGNYQFKLMIPEIRLRSNVIIIAPNALAQLGLGPQLADANSAIVYAEWRGDD